MKVLILILCIALLIGCESPERTHNFKIGDVVQLKSGGPLMTITYLWEGNTVSTAWHGYKMKIKKSSFKAELLNEVE